MSSPEPLPRQGAQPGLAAGTAAGPPTAATAADTTAENAWPVRTLSMKIGDYVEKMSALWVEGQVVQLSRRPGASTCFLTLRDTDVDMSLTVTIGVNALDALATPIGEGARVVVHAKPSFWTKRGTLQLDGRRIRQVGVGELLARLEHLKSVLRAEGLFDSGRKRPLPFIPHTVGLICGRASAAEKDVVTNARRRWPAVRFDVRAVPVQGSEAVTAISAALAELDAAPDVDVVVIARGGGSFEDLLAFSNETLIRAVAAARTPVVSAIGHDVDTPLLDFVADVRASTPTDAAKRIVPDLAEQRAGLAATATRGRRVLAQRVATERRHLDSLRSRPVLADPLTLVSMRRAEIEAAQDRAGRLLLTALRRGDDQIEHLRRSVRALSPQSTLDRGYAVVQHADGRVVMDKDNVEVDELLRVQVAAGDFAVRALGAPAG